MDIYQVFLSSQSEDNPSAFTPAAKNSSTAKVCIIQNLEKMNHKLVLLLLLFSFQGIGQENPQPKSVMLRKAVPGMCIPSKKVLELYNGNPDEIEPKCSMDKEELIANLNDDLKFLKDHPDFKGRGMVSVIINCEGKVIGWAEAVKSKNSELNDEILSYLIQQDFEWKAGQYKEEPIDSVFSFSYQIIRGKLRLN